jgi:hypothetical protein
MDTTRRGVTGWKEAQIYRVNLQISLISLKETLLLNDALVLKKMFFTWKNHHHCLTCTSFTNAPYCQRNSTSVISHSRKYFCLLLSSQNAFSFFLGSPPSPQASKKFGRVSYFPWDLRAAQCLEGPGRWLLLPTLFVVFLSPRIIF